ncbi:MAG: hypothetical protein DHS20C16_28750 [Phycisphaerae bacterium]|nr:MAG: hypothetical protein DHS20C16_28750 [Phycisphaerae bacterium]
MPLAVPFFQDDHLRIAGFDDDRSDEVHRDEHGQTFKKFDPHNVGAQNAIDTQSAIDKKTEYFDRSNSVAPDGAGIVTKSKQCSF